VIGVDGLSPDGVLKAKAPVLEGLRKTGAYSLHARAVMPTMNSPNWASMINGAGPEQHGSAEVLDRTSGAWCVRQPGDTR
jgi:predicted AlkP superfamily pyrophosphatase or phosphodiesterase